MEIDLIERLNAILQASASAKFNTTAALAAFTTLVCWTVQRARRANEARAQRMWQRWEQADGETDPWRLPGPLAKLKVGPALIQLRNALAHTDDASASPLNGAVEGYQKKQLIGFVVTAGSGEVVLHEDEMRRLGQVITDQYVSGLKPGS